MATAAPGWRQPVPDDERLAIERRVRELGRLAEDLTILDRKIAEATLDDPAIRRLLTITGVNLTVAAGLTAAIGGIARFNSPQKLVSYFGFNRRVRQSSLSAAHHRADAQPAATGWGQPRPPDQLKQFLQSLLNYAQFVELVIADALLATAKLNEVEPFA